LEQQKLYLLLYYIGVVMGHLVHKFETLGDDKSMAVMLEKKHIYNYVAFTIIFYEIQITKLNVKTTVKPTAGPTIIIS
jgi:hypothetical protein